MPEPIPPLWFPPVVFLTSTGLRDEGIDQGTITGLNFVGTHVQASISGLKANVLTKNDTPIGPDAPLPEFISTFGVVTGVGTQSHTLLDAETLFLASPTRIEGFSLGKPYIITLSADLTLIWSACVAAGVIQVVVDANITGETLAHEFDMKSFRVTCDFGLIQKINLQKTFANFFTGATRRVEVIISTAGSGDGPSSIVGTFKCNIMTP